MAPALPCLPFRSRANSAPRRQSFNVDSPSEKVVDTDEYVGDVSEKDPVAIISPDDNGESDQQLQDLPLANDRMTLPYRSRYTAAADPANAILLDEAMKELALPPLLDEPKILGDFEHTWTVENWRGLGKREHGPVFHAGGNPWYADEEHTITLAG